MTVLKILFNKIPFSPFFYKKQKKKTKKEALIEEEVEPATITRILTHNKPEWHLMVMGLFFAALHGCVPIFFAFIIGQILGVSWMIDFDRL